MKITATTKILAIFGDPVSHSISPVIQGAALCSLGIDMVYLAFRVSPADLGEAVEAMRTLGLRGANITIPHKVAVMEHLDSIDETARALGAVNTILNNDGILKGYNTDAVGYMWSLEGEMGFTPRGRKALVIGAGGAARAVVYGLASGGVSSVLIANRTVARAEVLAKELAAVCPGVEITAMSLGSVELAGYLEKTDLLVNATSLGMSGGGEVDVSLHRLPAGAIVSDIVYIPMETKFLKKARTMGLKTHSGIGMLVGAALGGIVSAFPAAVSPFESMQRHRHARRAGGQEF
ncbi:MAG: shikimate dehydrogenase [Thermodesulfobacteriota bacterium]